MLRRWRHGMFVNPHWLVRRADSAEVRVIVMTQGLTLTLEQRYIQPKS